MDKKINIRGLFKEKNIHIIFEVSLWLKGLFALSEIISGVIIYFASKQFLLGLVQWVTRAEFAEDSKDIIASYLLYSAQNLSLDVQYFTAFYLLAHGLIKLWLILGLLFKKIWYYPVAMVIFGLFIVYQLYRYNLTHSIWLILITLLDIIVIWLTWHEFRFLKSKVKQEKI